MISVITATIPGREDMLTECRASIDTQTYRDFQHLEMLDEDREGCSVIVNKLVAAADGEWLFFLADDDIALPRCLELHMERAEKVMAEIVYGPPLVWGIHDPWWFHQAPPAIPSTALMRKDLFLELGGYDESVVREEDRGLWTRAVEIGARFRRINEPTWVYRIHGQNKSMVGTQWEQVAA